VSREHSTTPPGNGHQLRTITLAVEPKTDGSLPTDVRLFNAGKIETRKGTFFFTSDSSRQVMEESRAWGNEHSFDYEHAAMYGGPAPAAAWHGLEARDTANGPELWATNVRWTPKATQMLKDREYRYTSPAFWTDEDGQITGYINTALTNIPATRNMDALIAANLTRQAVPQLAIADDGLIDHPGTTPRSAAVQPQEVQMKTVMQALGLAPEASEDAALREVTTLKGDRDAVQALRALVPDGADMVGTITAWRDGATQAETLATQLAERDDAEAKTRVDALLERGKADRKLTPASAEALRTTATDANGKVDPARIEAYLNAAPRIAALATPPAREPAGGADAPATPGTQAKTAWEALSNVDRHQLAVNDRAEFDRLLAEHRSARS